MEDNNVYPLQRVNDEHIMTCIITPGKFKDKEIQSINYCQVYFNVTTVADVTLANGKHLDPYMINGTTSLYGSKSIHMDINQAKSGHASWTTWKKEMKLWATRIDFQIPLQEWNMNTFIKYERDNEDGPIFRSSQPSQWIPSSSSVPIHVTTSHGAVTWEGE
eukprot:11050129-Ditylum_brightwellii.AAC.1